MWCCVTGSVIPGVLKDHSALIFSVQQFKKNLTLLQTVKETYFLCQSVNVLHKIHAKQHVQII